MQDISRMLMCNKNCAVWRVTKGLRGSSRDPENLPWFVILSEAKDPCNLLTVPRCKQLHGSFASLKMKPRGCRDLRTLLQPAAIHRNCRARDVLSAVAGQPNDQARDRGRLHPLRCVGAGHVLTICGR